MKDNPQSPLQQHYQADAGIKTTIPEIRPGPIDGTTVHQQNLVHNMISGSTAGVVCCLLFYPLESVEARMQLARKAHSTTATVSSASTSTITSATTPAPATVAKDLKGVPAKSSARSRKEAVGFFSVFRRTVKTEGFKALYKGVTPTVIGAAWNSAWYMSLYEYFKYFVHSMWSKAETSNVAEAIVDGVQYSSGEMLIAAIISGIICTFLSNPFYTLKIRMLTQRDGNKGMISTVRDMVKNEGIFSLWKGVVPSLFGVSEGAIQLVAYENLVGFFTTLFVGYPALSNSIHFISGSISRALSILMTYPYQVIRTRLMAADSPYTGLVDCIKKTARQEGFHGFYGGLLPNLTRQLTPAGIFFTVYSFMRNMLAKYF